MVFIAFAVMFTGFRIRFNKFGFYMGNSVFMRTHKLLALCIFVRLMMTWMLLLLLMTFSLDLIFTWSLSKQSLVRINFFVFFFFIILLIGAVPIIIGSSLPFTFISLSFFFMWIFSPVLVRSRKSGITTHVETSMTHGRCLVVASRSLHSLHLMIRVGNAHVAIIWTHWTHHLICIILCLHSRLGGMTVMKWPLRVCVNKSHFQLAFPHFLQFF